MKTIILECAQDYLNGLMNKELFISKAKELYRTVIMNHDLSISLDLFAIIPFLHELAYAYYSESELLVRVADFVRIFMKDEEYSYSTFLTLDTCQEITYCPLTCASNSYIKRVSQLFSTQIEHLLTIKDVLHNSLYDLLSKTDFDHTEQELFDMVNCKNDIQYEDIIYRIDRIFAYYCGAAPFMITMTKSPNTGSIFTIL